MYLHKRAECMIPYVIITDHVASKTCVCFTDLFRHLQHFLLEMFGKPFKFYMVVLLSAIISNYFVCQNILKVMELFIVPTRPECKFMVRAMLNGQYMTFQWTQHKHHWNQQNFLGLAAASGDWLVSNLTFLLSSGNWVSPLIMRTENVLKTLVYSLFDHLMLLPARGRLIEIQSPWKLSMI
jgi:hypothetical protein